MKTVEEWKQAFNLYYNNIASNKAPGMEPYEISRVLTDAEYSVVSMLCNGTLPRSFEVTEEMTASLSSLVKQGSGTLATGSSIPHIVEGSYVFSLPENLLLRTYESCHVNVGGKSVEAIVVPVTQDDFWRTHRDPFRRSNDNKVLRLEFADSEVTTSTLGQTMYSEIVSAFPVLDYKVRYVMRPKPIILEELTSELSIDGETAAMPCLLDEHLHQTILTEAVRIAKQLWA